MTTDEPSKSDHVGRYADLAAGARTDIYDRQAHRARGQSDGAHELTELW